MHSGRRCGTWVAVWIAVAVGLTMSFVVAGRAAGQLPATIVGHVTDTTGAAVDGAEVVLQRGDSSVLKVAKSNKRGAVTLRDLPAGSYTVTARKIGYGAAQGTAQLHAGDTLYLDVALPPLAVTLAPIVVKARRSRLRLSADDFNPKSYRDAMAVILDRRRDMLGDPERCAPPDPVLGGPVNDSVTRFAVNDRLTLSGGNSRQLDSLRKRPWLDSLRYGFNEVRDLLYVQRLYVNGQRVDSPKTKGPQLVNGQIVDTFLAPPGRSVVDELRRIPADRIAEIRYADCWDQSVPFYQTYALYVVLKPVDQAVQDSIWRSLTRPRDSVHP